MTKFYSTLLLTLAIPLLSSAADSVEVAGDRYPKTLEAKGVAWELQGAHHYKYKVFFSVFTGALYQQAEGDGRRLQFTYTRDIKGDDLRKSGMNQLNATNDAETLAKWEELTTGIQKAYENVSDGDSYVITVVPGKGTWLDFNGETVFHTDNAEFGFWYLDIWLGPEPISGDLKSALMGDS